MSKTNRKSGNDDKLNLMIRCWNLLIKTTKKKLQKKSDVESRRFLNRSDSVLRRLKENCRMKLDRYVDFHDQQKSLKKKFGNML